MATAPFAVAAFLVGVMVLSVGVACGQTYPNKPIRIVTSQPGGGSDFVSRLVAQGISGSVGQPVIVDNRGSALMVEIVASAPADGYSLLVTGTSFWIAPLLRKVSYDPIKDFSPISLLVNSPNVLVVHPTLPVRSVKELIDLAKAKPGELNYASTGAGSSTHLDAELFKAMTGVNIVHIPYKGSGPAIINLVGGQIQLMIATAAAVAPHIKSGKLRAVAVTGAQPSALFPGLPTIAATVPGYESEIVYGIYSPAKTPEAIISRLNQEVVRALNQPDLKQKFFDARIETVGSSPKEIAARMKSEMARMAKVIKDAGIRED